MKARMTLSGLLIKKEHLDFSVWNLVCESEEQFMIHCSCLICLACKILFADTLLPGL